MFGPEKATKSLSLDHFFISSSFRRMNGLIKFICLIFSIFDNGVDFCEGSWKVHIIGKAQVQDLSFTRCNSGEVITESRFSTKVFWVDSVFAIYNMPMEGIFGEGFSGKAFFTKNNRAVSFIVSKKRHTVSWAIKNALA